MKQQQYRPQITMLNIDKKLGQNVYNNSQVIIVNDGAAQEMSTI